MLKQRISKSQIETVLIVLFLLVLISLTRQQGITNITGKQYGYCGDGVCDADENQWNCLTDCAPTTPTTPTTPIVTVTPPPTQPACSLSTKYCLEQTPPQDFDSVACKCIPFTRCSNIPRYEACASNQHCPPSLKYLYPTSDAPYGCCIKGKCEAGKLCSLYPNSEGSCRTSRAYLGGPCYTESEDGTCQLNNAGNGCYCKIIQECTEGAEECIANKRRYCKDEKWVIESCIYGCELGKCKPKPEIKISTTEQPECSEGDERCADAATREYCYQGSWQTEPCQYGCEAGRCKSSEYTKEDAKEEKIEYPKEEKYCLEAIKKFPNRYQWDEYKKVCECASSLETECKTGKSYSSEIKAQVIDLREWIPYQYGDGTDCECKCPPDVSALACAYVAGETVEKWTFNPETCLCYPSTKTCESQFGQVCTKDEECLCGKEKELYSSQTNKISKCCLYPGHCGKLEIDFECDSETIEKARLLFAAKLIDAGKIEHAKVILQDLIESNSPLKGKAQAALSFALTKEGKFSEALAQVQQALKTNSKDEYIVETTNNVISAVCRIMLGSIGEHSVAISKAYAEQMHIEGIEIDPKLYSTAPEEVIFLRFQQLHEGLVDLGMRGLREGYYGQDYLSSFEKAQNDLALRGTTILTLSALLKEGIPFNSIINAAKECSKRFCSACTDLDYAIDSLPQSNLKSFYSELQARYKVQPSSILAGFLTQDRDGVLLSQYGTPEAVAEGTFRFEDSSIAEEVIPSELRKIKGLEILENIVNAETLLMFLVPQTQITTLAGQGVTLSQVVSQATGIASVAAYMKPWQRVAADLAIAFGLAPALEAAGADPAAAQKLAMIAAIFSPFTSGGNLRQLETLDKFGDNFIKAVDDEIFGKIITTDTTAGVMADFNSQLKSLLNREGFSSLASARGALAEALAKAQPGILTSEEIAQKVFANLDDIVSTALKNTLAEVAPDVLRKFLIESAYCSFAPEPLHKKPPESVISRGVYDEKAAAEIVEKGEYVKAGAYGETHTGKLLISPDDIASGKVKFLTDLTPDELQTALKQGVIIKIPSQPIPFTEEREITEKAIADLKKEIQIYTEIAKKAPEIGTPRPLLEIKKFDPATGLEYSELVMTAIKNPAGAYNIEGPKISVTLGDIINNRIRGKVYLALDAYEDFARKIKTLHEKVKIAQNDLHFNNILVTSEGKLVPIDFGKAVSQPTYPGPAASTWRDEAAQYAWEAALREDNFRLQLLQNEIRRFQGKPPIPLPSEPELQNAIKKAIDEAFYFSSTSSQCPLK